MANRDIWYMSMKQPKEHRGITVFYSYASADKELRDQLAMHLIQLKRDELISEWHNQQILAGSDRAQILDQAIHSTHLILLLLIALVDGLPLALDQAGAYMEETGTGLSRYLKLYKTQRKVLLKRRSSFPTDHPEPVASTWSLSLQKIEKRNPVAANLLRFCAFLQPDAIPEELLTEDGITERTMEYSPSRSCTITGSNRMVSV